MTLRFNDGVEFDTSGELRVESRHDGLYVVGEGRLCAVESREEGLQLIEKMKQTKATAKPGPARLARRFPLR